MEKSHVIFDLYKASEDTLSKAELLEKALLAALEALEIKPEIKHFHQFEPYGVTASISAKQLQFHIHTWPEHGSCTIDMYCFEGGQRFAVKVCEEIKKHINADEYEMKVLKRHQLAVN